MRAQPRQLIVEGAHEAQSAVVRPLQHCARARVLGAPLLTQRHAHAPEIMRRSPSTPSSLPSSLPRSAAACECHGPCPSSRHARPHARSAREHLKGQRVKVAVELVRRQHTVLHSRPHPVALHSRSGSAAGCNSRPTPRAAAARRCARPPWRASGFAPSRPAPRPAPRTRPAAPRPRTRPARALWRSCSSDPRAPHARTRATDLCAARESPARARRTWPRSARTGARGRPRVRTNRAPPGHSARRDTHRLGLLGRADGGGQLGVQRKLRAAQRPP
jgi:hypothetical protein